MNFTLQNEYITLSQLLKACNIIDSGGQAKVYLSGACVKVNGQLEMRRGRKLYRGDIVELRDNRIHIE